MTSLLISNHNKYTSTHEAFKLSNLAYWADVFGVDVFVRCFDETPKLAHPRLHYTDAKDDETIIRDLQSVLTRLKPSKVVNLVEGFFPWNMVDTAAERIYFVRSCAAKTLSVIVNAKSQGPGWNDAVALYTERAEREKRYLSASDVVLTDSPNSHDTIYEYYGVSSEICLEYINPDLYRLPKPRDRQLVYNVGRTDYIKGVQWISPSPRHSVISIGGNELGSHACVSDHIVCHSWMPREEYVTHIKNSVFGVFPALWESNGYAVQECLAMGKIPIVQECSGGNQRLLTPFNSVLVDFAYGHGIWWEHLDDIDVEKMCDVASNTLTYSMYKTSLDKFGDAIC